MVMYLGEKAVSPTNTINNTTNIGYTKEEINEQLALKANVETTYTKEEVNNLLSEKVSITLRKWG